jgi:hypothetical protein
MAYGIFESTNISGKNYSFVSAVDIENGTLLHKGDLVTGSKDVYQAIIPTTASIAANTPVYVVGNPAWSYDTGSVVNQNEDAYIIKAGIVFRVYELKANDKFGIADYGIDGTPAVGEYVGLQNASGKPVAAVSAPANGFVGKVIEITQMGFDYFVGVSVSTIVNKVRIEVVKNG